MVRSGNCWPQNGNHLASQPHRGRGALAAPEPKQDRQAHRMRAERQLDDDPDDDPPVAAPERVGVLRGTVVGPERAEHPPAPAAEQRVVDDHLDRRVRVEQPGHDQPRQRQAEPIGIPGMRREEPTARVERHHRRHARPGEHADHRAPGRMRDQARWPAARTTRTSTTGETRDETSPTEHATKRVGSGPEASAELHLGVDNSDNRRCFVTLTTRSRRHAE